MTVATQDFDPYEICDRYGIDNVELWIDAAENEQDLSLFLKNAWHSFDPTKYMHNWHVDAIADHLMAVTDGSIKKLLINVPFRTTKTQLVSVAWPAWTWAQGQIGPRSGAKVKFLCLSYASVLSMESSTTMRRLISSEWYQRRWGHRVRIDPKQDNKEKFDTTKFGSRISVGFDGGTMGRGGDIKIIDDPHKVKELESDDVREGTLKTYDEALSSRFTDPETSAEVTIMQRLHEGDLSGHILERHPDVVHLMLPMRFEPLRMCHTRIGWSDPRGLDKDGEVLEGIVEKRGKLIVVPGSPMDKADGTLLFPKRFTPEVVDSLEASLGPYATAGQLQQAPTPRGGGIIKSEWWKLWADDVFPDMRLSVVSVDTAHTADDKNDEAGITGWGVWDDDQGLPQVILTDGWEGHLELHSLVMKVIEIARARKADYVVIEAKANGIDVANEVRRLMKNREWTVVLFDPKGDKQARLLSVQHFFSGKHVLDPTTGTREWVGGNVWAPDRAYAQMVIDRVAGFPKGRRKGIVDTVSQVMRWLGDNILVTAEEHHDALEDELIFKRQRKLPYDT